MAFNPLVELTAEDWQQTLGVDLLGRFIKHTATPVIKQRGGSQ